MGIFDYEREEEQQELSAAELVNNESLRQLGSKNRSKRVRQNIFYLVLAVVLLGGAVAVGGSFFFRLKSMEIRGNARYTVEEITSVCNVNSRTNLLFLNTSAIKDRILEAFPYIQNVSVQRNLPDKITVTVEEDAAAWYSKIWGDWFVLSGELKVMEKIDGPEQLGSGVSGLKWVKFPEVDYAVAGEKIVFSRETAFDYTVSFLNELKKMSIFGDIEYIDCSDRYHMALYMNEGRYRLVIGDSSNLESKLRLIQRIIETDSEISVTSIYSFNAEYLSPVIVSKGDETYIYG